MDSSFVATYAAPAASNYSAEVGKAVALTAVAAGAGRTEARATLMAAATACPLGIIVSGENYVGGVVSVCIGGPVYALAGAAITPGTNVWLSPDGTGRLIPSTEGDWAVGRFIGKQVQAAGDIIQVFVQPELYDVVDAVAP